MADQLTEATERLERLLVEALGSRHEAVTDWAAVKFALRDAARFRWLAERMLAADFDWQDSGECVLVFRYPVWGSVSADARKTIDSGIRNEHPPSETTDGVTEAPAPKMRRRLNSDGNGGFCITTEPDPDGVAPSPAPSLWPVIQWLEGGCDPKEAAKELRLYAERMGQPAPGVLASPHVNPLCGVHGPIPCEGARCICGKEGGRG